MQLMSSFSKLATVWTRMRSALEGLSLNVFGSRHARVELYQSLQLWGY